MIVCATRAVFTRMDYLTSISRIRCLELTHRGLIVSAFDPLVIWRFRCTLLELLLVWRATNAFSVVSLLSVRRANEAHMFVLIHVGDCSPSPSASLLLSLTACVALITERASGENYLIACLNKQLLRLLRRWLMRNLLGDRLLKVDRCSVTSLHYSDYILWRSLTMAETVSAIKRVLIRWRCKKTAKAVALSLLDQFFRSHGGRIRMMKVIARADKFDLW